MVDSGATNSYMHSEVIQYLNGTTINLPDIRVTLADGSYVFFSNAIPLYL